VIGERVRAAWWTLLGILLASLAACSTPLHGEHRDGRYFDPSGTWSVDGRTSRALGAWSFDLDERPHAVFAYAAGCYGGPDGCVSVAARPREAGLDLGRLADDLCRVVLAGSALPGAPAPELVHESRRELAGAPAELRVFVDWDEGTRGTDVQDLFAEQRKPWRLHAVFAVERGPALVTFRMSVTHGWSDRRFFRPTDRLVLEGNWPEFLAWIDSFRWEAPQPDAHGSLE
jgi:hypothetical protein